MKDTVYGYIRVSTREQNEARQKIALRSFPVPEENIYMDKMSGKDFERDAYQELVRKLERGDLLGRNYEEILEQWRILTRIRQVDIVVLDMPLLDTRKKGDDLTGTFVADLVLQILSYVAQSERENIRKRQAEGIAAAKARGVHFGNPGKPVPADFAETVEKWRRKEIRLPEALEHLGIGRTYFYRHVKLLEL